MIRVIGAGFGKTGTTSNKLVLEHLDFGTLSPKSCWPVICLIDYKWPEATSPTGIDCFSTMRRLYPSLLCDGNVA